MVLLETFCEIPRIQCTCHRSDSCIHVDQPPGCDELDTRHEDARPLICPCKAPMP